MKDKTTENVSTENVSGPGSKWEGSIGNVVELGQRTRYQPFLSSPNPLSYPPLVFLNYL